MYVRMYSSAGVMCKLMCTFGTPMQCVAREREIVGGTVGRELIYI